MLARDLFAMASRGLWEQKLRTALTLLGVMIAAVLMILSLSVGEGMQKEVERQFQLGDRLRRVEVMPGRGGPEATAPEGALKVKGEMSDEKRKRIRKAMKAKWALEQRRPRIPIDSAMLRKLEALPHVKTVEPEISKWCTMMLAGDQNGQTRSPAEFGSVRGISLRDSVFPEQIVAGRQFTTHDSNEILVHEFLAYRWGIPGDDDVEKLIGKTVRLERRQGPGIIGGANAKLSADEARVLGDISRQLPKLLATLPLTETQRAVIKKVFGKSNKKTSPKLYVDEYVIVGVFREPAEEESPTSRRRRFRGEDGGVRGADIAMPLRTAEEFAEKVPQQRERGFFRVTLIVDDERHVEAVTEELSKLELNFFALTDILERIQFNIQVISTVMALLAGVVLFVAALGIANTMVMTVLERTHEIGVMKAVGAGNGDIQRVFLVEGALVGMLGGLFGTLFGWAISIPINAYVIHRLESRFRQAQLESLFAFPVWLLFGVPLFAAMITMLASVYPARRAAKIDPIQALRHN